MGPTMKLIEAIRDLDILDEEGTIHASQPWAENSEAIVAHEPESGGLPDEAEQLGLIYFLDVFIARDFVESWMASSTRNRPYNKSVQDSLSMPSRTLKVRSEATSDAAPFVGIVIFYSYCTCRSF